MSVKQRKDENQTGKKAPKSSRVLMSVLFIVVVFCVVFTGLCIYFSGNEFIKNHALLLTITSGLFLFGGYSLAIFLYKNNKETFFKTIFSTFVFIAFCVICCFVLLKTGFFNVIKDTESLQAYLARAGAWMPVFYVLLQFLQVVILPIPSIVSTLAGVALFGALKATLYSLLGILLGSLTAFFIGKKWGSKAVGWMLGTETLRKWQNKLKGKDNLVLTLMFLMPVFPDDILCFVAGLSSMSIMYFLVMIIVTRSIGIFATCYSIDFIPFTTWWGIMIWAIILIALTLLFVFLYKNIDKIQKFAKRFKKKK
jgi:uncharacterized membrane protein YdjX (TVP38/TMEM64 family)